MLGSNSGALRSRAEASWLPILLVLVAWDACQVARLQRPMRIGPDAWIGRQIGRTARNHLVLGLATTRGANVTTIAQDGRLEVHRSYAPLASWVVALPLQAGFPFETAIRIPVLVSTNAFLLGLWHFARTRWGPRVAILAAAYAAFCPILLLKYGITCIFEILALGPLMVAVALFAQPARNPRVWAALAVSSIAAAMFSWITWLVIVPCILREFRAGRRAEAIGLGACALPIPVLIHFGTMAMASGDPVGDLTSFFLHIAERSSNRDFHGRPTLTYAYTLRLLERRWVRDIGLIPLAAAVACLASIAVPRLRLPGWRWLVLLFAFALPLNLARNIALHDFFVILFVPVAALAAGLVTAGVADRFPTPRGRAVVTALILLAFLGLDLLPKRRMLTLTPATYEWAAISDEVGRVVAPGDFVIASPEFVGQKDRAVAPDDRREQSPRPYYCGQMAQTVFVAYDGADAARLAARARPGQRVVVLQLGGSPWELPRHFARLESGPGPLWIAASPTALARSR